MYVILASEGIMMNKINLGFIKPKHFKRLLKDQAGNTLIILVASLIPIIGIIGSAVDLGRGYMTRTRLQQACDTGVLAARRSLTGQSILTDTIAQDEGQKFFRYNFSDGTFGIPTDANTFQLVEGSETGSIAATANVAVPTTLFRIFGQTEIDVGVNCDSSIDVGNVDIMLSLDTTLSMNQILPSGVSRIRALRQAVENFYRVIGPGGGTNNNRIRYGFVPYAGNVNVGRILYDGNDFTDRWLIGEGDGTSTSGATRSQRLHTRRVNRTTGVETYGFRNVFMTHYVDSIIPSNPEAQLRSEPIGVTERWEGCIVERPTVHIPVGATSIPSGALDLDIDLIPTNDRRTRWIPHWPSVIYYGDPIRQHFRDYTSIAIAPQLGRCPSPTRNLQSYPAYDEGTSDDLQSYINGLQLRFVTNHTIGLVWAARLISPTGLFAAENSSAPNGRPITRHIVFMTDGEMFINNNDYDVNGFHAVEAQIAPTGADNGALTAIQETRFSLVCERVKSMGINIWIVEINDDPVVSPLMEACASAPEQAFVVTDQDELIRAFSTIANQIGGLRLS